MAKEPFKWNRIDEEAILESEKAKPSSDPKYWAKRSCSACYGRGVLGTITQKIGTNTIKNEQLCPCAKKRFVAWRTAFVEEFIRKHTSSGDSGIDSTVDKTP